MYLGVSPILFNGTSSQEIFLRIAALEEEDCLLAALVLSHCYNLEVNLTACAYYSRIIAELIT